MKLLKSGLTANAWSTTDELKPEILAKRWEENHGTVVLDGTIDKLGTKHTQVGIQLSDDDILALMHSSASRMKEALEQTQKDLAIVQEVLKKIHWLSGYRRDMAPTKDELLDGIAKIARHYCFELQAGQPAIDWLKWDELGR